jgi:regulator of RNase E activity RraA
VSDPLPASAFTGLPTAALSDAMDRLAVPAACQGIRPLAFGRPLLGRAFTVRYVATGRPPGTVGDFVDDVAPGDVVVIDNGGREDCTVWGDILTAVAAQRGVAGTVIDGVCRDVRRALDIGYPVYSRGWFMRTGKDRVTVSDIGTPVSVAGIRVRAGDLLVGDDDGVVVVPAEVEHEVLAVAREIEEREGAILAAALAGATLREARAAHGYHDLQRAGRTT